MVIRGPRGEHPHRNLATCVEQSLGHIGEGAVAAHVDGALTVSSVHSGHHSGNGSPLGFRGEKLNLVTTSVQGLAGPFNARGVAACLRRGISDQQQLHNLEL